MLKKLIVVVCGALMVPALSPSDHLKAASAYPCAPDLAPSPEFRPTPPTGLRILRGPAASIEPEFLASAASPRAFSMAAGPTGPHAYFENLALRRECMVAYSLRSMEQLLEYMDSKARGWDVTYRPGEDSDSRRQDAAKIVIPAGGMNLPNNVRLPIPPVAPESLFVTWDAWMGREFEVFNGSYKHFQFASPLHYWTEIKADFGRAKAKFPGSLATAHVRAYGEVKNGELGADVTNENPLSPMLTEFDIRPETWTRYWAYFNPIGGDWFEFSFWLADENRDPVLINDRLPMKPGKDSTGRMAEGWEKFWIEYNTSSRPDESWGPRVSYVRNVVMLRGVKDPTSLLERPVK